MKKAKLVFSVILIIMSLSDCTYGQDWANLNRFKDANALLMESSEGENGIVFIGNSITEGWIQDELTFFNNTSYINRGIGGQTTPQMLLRFRADVVELTPRVVVILAGINDIAGNTGPSTIEMIMHNIKSMAEIARANGIAVVLSSVLPARDFSWNPELEPADKVIRLNQLIRNYCDKKDLIYLDYYSSMVNKRKGLKKKLTYDGVHPNTAGYRVMEPLANKAIKKALKE